MVGLCYASVIDSRITMAQTNQQTTDTSKKSYDLGDMMKKNFSLLWSFVMMVGVGLVGLWLVNLPTDNKGSDAGVGDQGYVPSGKGADAIDYVIAFVRGNLLSILVIVFGIVLIALVFVMKKKK